MRKIGMALGLVGGFLVMVALLANFYAAGQLMRTPIDIDSTTRLAGTATIGDEEETEVRATSITRANSEKSDEDVVVFVNSSCLVRDIGDVPNCVSADDPQERLITASVDNFATDRKTALSVNDPSYLPADAVEHEGLVNKWPFDAEQKTYPLWNGTLGTAVDATFDGEETIDGLTVYKYVSVVEDEPITLSEGVEGTLSSTTEYFVEPTTGSIINQIATQERVTDEGDNFLSADLEFTPEQIEANVADARSNADSLGLVTSTLPLWGLIIGIPLLLIGLLLVFRGGGRHEADA